MIYIGDGGRLPLDCLKTANLALMLDHPAVEQVNKVTIYDLDYKPEHYSIIKITILNSADQGQVHQKSTQLTTFFPGISPSFMKKI